MAKVNSGYKHFKGGKYNVVLIAKNCETLEEEVVYQQIYENDEFPIGTFWVRSLKEFDGFTDIENKKIKRFEEIKK